MSGDSIEDLLRVNTKNMKEAQAELDRVETSERKEQLEIQLEVLRRERQILYEKLSSG